MEGEAFHALYTSHASSKYGGKLTFEDGNTDFWGPASNFGIPIAAVMDVKKDPEM